MGTTERRQREKKIRRDVIISAAKRVFFRPNGLESATMEDIAAEAELSKGALYLYFRNKEDLLAGIHLQGLHLLKETLEQIMTAETKGIEKLEALARGYAIFSQQYPEHFSIMMAQKIYEMNNRPGELEPHVQQCVDMGLDILSLVAQTIRRGIRDNSIKSSNHPEKTALLLWAQMHGVLELASKKDEHLERLVGCTMQEFLEYSIRRMVNEIKNEPKIKS